MVENKVWNAKTHEFPLEDCPFCDNSGSGKDVRGVDICLHDFTIDDYYAMIPVIEEITQDLATMKVAHKQMIRIVLDTARRGLG